MTKQTEAMKLALEALEFEAKAWEIPPTPTLKALTALREALAQERSSDEQPAQRKPLTDDAPADCRRLAEHGAPICWRCHMGPCKYTSHGIKEST